MKNEILNHVALMLVSGTLLLGCNVKSASSEKTQDKVQEAQENVAEAKADLKDVMLEFRKESAEKIAANEKSIAQIKVKIAEENAENKSLLEQTLSEIEKKNTDLKMKLEDYKEQGGENWDAFKDEFNHDLEELGKAFKDFAVNNIK